MSKQMSQKDSQSNSKDGSIAVIDSENLKDTVKKKVKLNQNIEQERPLVSGHNSNKNEQKKFQDMFLQAERNKVLSFFEAVQDYPKITAHLIQHQERSISTLPQNLRGRFSELSDRITRSIQCCRVNAEFLFNVHSVMSEVFHVKEELIEKRQQRKPKSNLGSKGLSEAHEHEHTCTHESEQNGKLMPNQILNIFSHICREYSEEQIHVQERRYMELIVKTVKDLITDRSVERDQSSQAQSPVSLDTLVVGCGMGRILQSIRRLYDRYHVNSKATLQGHESEVQYYVLCEYFTNYSQTREVAVTQGKGNQNKSKQIFPYVHNFSNHWQSGTPFMPVQIQETAPISDNSRIEQQTEKKSQSQYHHVGVEQQNSFPISKPIPITFGKFSRLYRDHFEMWDVIVTCLHNYEVTDILAHIQLIYKALRPRGVWIDISTSNFDRSIVSYMSRAEYDKVLDKSMFQTVHRQSFKSEWYPEPNKMMTEWRKVYFRVMVKQ